MPAEIPELIKPLLEAYITALESDLPDLMTGFYLHGSIALGAFNPNFSDIDFITVVNRRCTANDLERLTAIHQMLEKDYPQWPLQGSYLLSSDLGKFEDEIDPYPCYSDGRLDPYTHHDINSVTWWLLKNRGLTLVGTLPENLDFLVGWTLLATAMLENLNTYWARFTWQPSRMAWLFSDYGIQWAVLGVLRQFYTFQERDIASKTGAGEYALKHLPQGWHRLIQEALNIRNQRHKSLYQFRVVRAVEAVRFLGFIIRICNDSFT